MSRLQPSTEISGTLGHRVLAMAEELAAHSDSATSLSCTYLTPAHLAAQATIARWMTEAGLVVRQDAAGNVIGVLKSSRDNAATLVTGSHYDTVRNGGKFDGRLGIILAVLVVSEFKRTGVALPYDLEIVAFAEEEGARFRTSFLGSSAYIGQTSAHAGALTDANGTTLAQALQDVGRSIEALVASPPPKARICGYIEVHIEQGPVLLKRGLPLGIVSSIAGSTRFEVNVVGMAGHAGTTPMSMRQDACAAASEMVLAIESRCSTVPSLVGTVGQFEVPNGSVNVIAGKCRFSIDIRAAQDEIRDSAVADVQKSIAQIADRRGVTVELRQTMSAPCVPCSPELTRALELAVSHTGIEPFQLVSGAGHDAMMLARVTGVAMLFVRCGNGGISHNPRETITAEDARLALAALSRFLIESRFAHE